MGKVAVAGAAMLMAAGVAYGGQTAPASPLPPGPALDLLNQACVSCHTLTTITAKRKSADDWAATIQQMAGRGAEVSPEEAATLTAYLAKNLPAEPAHAAGATH
ncbi:hypothetical protein ACG3SL_05835 [Sphingomonas sp. CJ20]